MANYAWHYMGISVAATLDGAVTAKQGFRTQTAPTQEITGFFVDFGAQNSQYAYQQITIAYREPGAPKTKAIRLNAGMNQPQFTAFVEALAAARPQADLRKLPRAEAFKQLGVADVQKVTLIAMPIVVVALMSIATLPLAIHGFDKGEQRVTAAEIGTAKLSSRNLVLSGELETRNYLEITHTKNGVKQSAEYLFPVYPEGADDDALVPVVLKTAELPSSQIRTLANATEWKCTLRNLLWEGLGGDDRDYFHDTLHVNVTKETLLCEYAPKPPMDGMMFFMINGLGLGLMVIITFVVWRRRQK